MTWGAAFDLEGTLVDLEAHHHAGHLAAARGVGLEMTLEEARVRIAHFVGGPDREVAREICALAGRGSAPDVLAASRGYFDRAVEGAEIAVRPGAVEFIGKVLAMGAPVALGSLTERRYARLILERSGLASVFGAAAVVLAEDVEHLKPHPDVFFETARRMGVASTWQIVFEDSPRGVEAAAAAGSIPVGMPVYRDLRSVVEIFGAGARRVFFDWREVEARGLVENLLGTGGP